MVEYTMEMVIQVGLGLAKRFLKKILLKALKDLIWVWGTQATYSISCSGQRSVSE
jgi:hypothetical protein